MKIAHAERLNVRQAFAAYREGHYAVALEAYRALADRLGEKNFQLNIRLCEDQLYRTPQQRLAALPAQRLKVAAVMDEFTFHSYDSECELRQLDPKNCLQQLEAFKPDLLFIESAWEGIEHLWKTKISGNSPEIRSCITWCKARDIPTLFWSKEDPVHFDTFMPLAKQVDWIFTTDIDCIPRYKYHAGHDRVFLLPFAAQPRLHHPIESLERKDAFNFAGSYYLKYPERQRDFAALIEAVKDLRSVEIYDRHAEDANPRFAFPDAYKPMILGKLPFAEIDRAYKGYRYGINLNTVKQSQTMFARRVFELLASNTVVVSNFSRGMRLLFGDAVISSDNADQLRERLKSISKDDVIYRKFRLLGLRKVMSAHTYAHRLAYIRSKITSEPIALSQPPVLLLGRANTPEELQELITSFNQQRYPHKRLFIAGPAASGHVDSDRIVCHLDSAACLEQMPRPSAQALVGVLASKDHYGDNYLVDLVLASKYSKAVAFGKITHYRASPRGLELAEPGQQYRPAHIIRSRAGLARHDALDEATLQSCLENPESATFEMLGMLGIDEFNYIENGFLLADAFKAQSDDLPMPDQGVPFPGRFDLIVASQPTAPRGDNPEGGKLPQIDAATLHEMIPSKTNVQLNRVGEKLEILSTLSNGKTEYLYARAAKTREEMNLVFSSHFQLQCETKLDLRTIFEFQDKDGNEIASQQHRVGGINALAVPAECSWVRFGFRVKGSGTAKIDKLVLGNHHQRPALVICRSSFLVLSKHYPSYEELSQYLFLHRRLCGYKNADMAFDVFILKEAEPTHYREFEGIDITTGDAQLLEATLASGQVKHVMVDFSDENLTRVLQTHADRIHIYRFSSLEQRQAFGKVA